MPPMRYRMEGLTSVMERETGLDAEIETKDGPNASNRATCRT